MIDNCALLRFILKSNVDEKVGYLDGLCVREHQVIELLIGWDQSPTFSF